MGSNGTEKILNNNLSEVSETTIGIKIKTLDSQTYTLRVDKQMPVPALKEHIASVTGVLSERQRLICQGKVLKDDELLSAYHVEDGHTLHLVVRHPDQPSHGSLPNHSATDPNSSTSHDQIAPGVFVETFNVPVQGDGLPPEFNRIISAVLGSIGISNFVGGSEGLYVMVIPDSLTTLSLYLSNIRHEFDAIVREGGDSVQVFEARRNEEIGSISSPRLGSTPEGLSSPASLAEVLLSTRQMLNEQVCECLCQLARQLENQADVTDHLLRSSAQSRAWRTGVQFYNLGATLLELGRTTMTLRLGQTPSEAVVNGGPAVYISPSGPNHIMVQPLPFQPGVSFGAVPVGVAYPSSGSDSGLGSSFFPRHIDIQIQRGTSTTTPIVNQEEHDDNQSATIPGNPGEIYANQATSRLPEDSSFARESGVQIVPIRTMIAAIPSPLGRPTSETSGSSPNPSIRQEPSARRSVNINILTAGGVQNIQESERQMPSTVVQFIRSLFPGDEVQVEDSSLQGTTVGSTSEHAETFRGAAHVPEAEPRVSDEGLFLSNLLCEVMPLISQRAGSRNLIAPERENPSEDQMTEDSSNQVGTSRRQSGSETSPPNPKRQKME